VVVLGLSVVAFGVEVFALVDAARTPPRAFVNAGKRTKTLWVAITAVAAALGFLSLPLSGFSRDPFGLLSILAVVGAGVYLADVRPAVREMRGGGRGGNSSGPYGPW